MIWRNRTMNWTYNGAPITEEIIGDSYGFVYVIRNKTDGRRYVGRKYFTKAGYKTVKGKRKKIRISSGWENYYGSNKVLLEDVKQLGEDNFERMIIRLCRNRSECSYYETHYIFQFGALLSDRWYNEWCTCKISKKHLMPKK
jgi:hypothetical protein